MGKIKIKNVYLRRRLAVLGLIISPVPTGLVVLFQNDLSGQISADLLVPAALGVTIVGMAVCGMLWVRFNGTARRYQAAKAARDAARQG